MQGPETDRLGSILYSIHGSTQNESAWNSALALLGTWLDSRWSILARHHFLSGHGEVLYDAPALGTLHKTYAEHGPRNPWFLSSDEYRTGNVIAGQDCLHNGDLVRTDFYKQVLQPHGLMHRLCGVALRRGELIYYLAVHRDAEQPAFSVSERRALAQIVAHAGLAIENAWQQRQLHDFRNVLGTVLNGTSAASLLTDREGSILFRNRMADTLLEQHAGLQVQQQRLHALRASESIRLQQAIRQAADNPSQAAVSIELSTHNAEHPAVLSIQPAGPLFCPSHGERRNLVAIGARAPFAPHEQCLFARQFDLTPAQTRLSNLLFTGYSLAGAARQLHVSENTVRSHLKRIFQKTNTHSQMELVHLHARICVD